MRDVHRDPLPHLHWHVLQPGCRVRITYILGPNKTFFQALLCEAQTVVAGSRGEAGRRGGHQDLNQPSRVKDSGQHCRILYCRRLHGGEMFTYPVLYQHHEKVKRAWYYCKACHEDVKNENQIKKCKCKNCGYFLSLFKSTSICKCKNCGYFLSRSLS